MELKVDHNSTASTYRPLAFHQSDQPDRPFSRRRRWSGTHLTLSRRRRRPPPRRRPNWPTPAERRSRSPAGGASPAPRLAARAARRPATRAACPTGTPPWSSCSSTFCPTSRRVPSRTRRARAGRPCAPVRESRGELEATAGIRRAAPNGQMGLTRSLHLSY